MAMTYRLGDKVNAPCIGTCPKDRYGEGRRHEHEVVELADQWGPGAVRVKCVDCGGTRLFNLPLTVSGEEDKDE
jgi:hypothetical protein